MSGLIFFLKKCNLNIYIQTHSNLREKKPKIKTEITWVFTSLFTIFPQLGFADCLRWARSSTAQLGQDVARPRKRA